MAAGVSGPSGNCGTCGEPIHPDRLTGTTCACARAGSSDKFKADPHVKPPLPAQAGSGEFAPAPPDQTYQHALVRRLWEAQLGNLPDDIKRLMAEAATELEGNLPATDDFVNSMRRKHAKVIR